MNKPVKQDYPIQPVTFTQVSLGDIFWAPRIETNRSVTIPFAFKQCEDHGRLYNFEAAAAAIKGKPFKDIKMTEYPFDDTDVYKVIEGASYSLAVKPDPKLDSYIDMLVEKIAAAQEPDGYLYTVRTMRPEKPHELSGPERWSKERVLSHELYNLGHLYEAAAAHFQATGKRGLLDISMRTVDLLDRTFGPDKKHIWPGHQIIEMGLVKLFRITGEERCLRLAKFMLDARGPEDREGDGIYNQAHMPVLQQTEAVGHAVRAGYMYAGMADVAALTGDSAYIDAIDRIWEDVVTRKLYITGGIGARKDGEAFGNAYELPNLTAYAETCAAIANVYWNHRLFLLHGRAAYIDVMERSLYNGVISGISLDGKSFFYPNPLESDGNYERQPWFGCACCPSNLARFLASISGYQYAVKEDAIYVNLFAAGEADINLEDAGEVRIIQKTRYPWDGEIIMQVRLRRPARFTINVRVPGWAREEAVQGSLYRFIDSPAPAITIKLNNNKQDISVNKDGYFSLDRDWHDYDQIRLVLPMPVRRIAADERVEADHGRFAIQRGPIVYCLESHDNPGVKVREAVLPADLKLQADFKPGMLGGISVIRGGNLTAIPYYAWANRGKAEMEVWVRK
jgi:DUF1680 family protein